MFEREEMTNEVGGGETQAREKEGEKNVLFSSVSA